MAWRRVSLTEAKAASGLRMAIVSGAPSPWGEAAKGLFHVKGIDWLAFDLAQDDPEMEAWIGGKTAPVAIYDDEAPVHTAMDITRLAERIAPGPTLLPESHAQDVMDLIIDLTTPGGLGWERRLQFVHGSFTTDEGYGEAIARYLGDKYGYSPEAGEASTAKVIAQLGPGHDATVDRGLLYQRQKAACVQIRGVAAR